MILRFMRVEYIFDVFETSLFHCSKTEMPTLKLKQLKRTSFSKKHRFTLAQMIKS